MLILNAAYLVSTFYQKLYNSMESFYRPYARPDVAASTAGTVLIVSVLSNSPYRNLEKWRYV